MSNARKGSESGEQESPQATRTTVVRWDSDDAKRQAWIGQPCAELRGLVDVYHATRTEYARGVRVQNKVEDCVTIGFEFLAPPRFSRGGQAVEEHDYFVGCGWQPSAFEIESGAGSSDFLTVEMTPLGAHMVFGISMSGMAMSMGVQLEAVLGRGAVELTEQLAETVDPASRFALLDHYFSARVRHAQPPSPDVEWAWRRLRQTEGLVPIAALARELGCSGRHLTRRFQEQVGESPKRAARVMRFRRATRLLDAGGFGHFMDVAHDCGYYDQSHFVHDFREMSGTTPTEYAARQAAERAQVVEIRLADSEDAAAAVSLYPWGIPGEVSPSG